MAHGELWLAVGIARLEVSLVGQSEVGVDRLLLKYLEKGSVVVLLLYLELLSAALKIQRSVGVVTYVCASWRDFAMKDEHLTGGSLERGCSQSVPN